MFGRMRRQEQLQREMDRRVEQARALGEAGEHARAAAEYRQAVELLFEIMRIGQRVGLLFAVLVGALVGLNLVLILVS